MYLCKLPINPPKGHVNPIFQTPPAHNPHAPPFTFSEISKHVSSERFPKEKISFSFLSISGRYGCQHYHYATFYYVNKWKRRGFLSLRLIFFPFFSLLDLSAIIWGAKRETRVLPTSIPEKMSIISSIIRVCRVSRNGFQESLLGCPQVPFHMP
jgi:hypothetical protein